MPANVESAVYANKPAWHREGIVLDTDGALGLTVPIALEQSGLDWTVEKEPVFTFQTGKPVPVEGRFAVVRSTDNKALGVVGNTWEPVQNTEGFQLIDDLLIEAGGEVFIEAAGALNGGRTVWVLAHCQADLQIAGDDFRRYILFTNGHDGRTAVTAVMTDVRVVCENTQGYAIQIEDGKNKNDPGSGRIVRVRHTRTATDRIKEARSILGLRNLRDEELAKQGEWLADQSISDAEFEGFLAKLLATEAEEGTPGHTMVQKRRDTIGAIYEGAKNLDNIRGTKWGAFQAVIEYADHAREFKTSETQLKAQWGLTPTPIKQQALRLLVA